MEVMIPTSKEAPARSAPLVDGFGRAARSLRVSVTDRCNLRCLYCMPEKGIAWFPKQRLLTFEEIERVVRALVGAGVRSVRLTGGEPLLRRDLPVLARLLSGIEGLEDLAVTTNGLLLREQARALLEAGVQRFNVHLDALDPVTFQEASRRDALDRALLGLRELERLGAVPIKVNVVLIKGVNDHEIARFAELARARPYQVRFIEMMPLGDGEKFEAERLVPGAEVRRRIEAIQPLVPAGRDRPSAPASVFRFADGVGDLGFINSVTEPFCARCDRLRLTADGMVRNCLFSRRETDLKPILRGGGSDAELLRACAIEVARKERGGSLDMSEVYQERLPRKMWQIGG